MRLGQPARAGGVRWSGEVLLLLAFLLSLPAVTPRLYASDEIEYFVYLRSLWFDGDLSFDNEYRHFYDAGTAKNPGFRETFLERETPTGRRLNFAPIGSALLWLPFFALGDAVARLAHAAGRPVAVDGYSAPYVAAVCYGSALYGLGAVILSRRVARRLTGEGSAALWVWLGTPLLFYMYVAPPMSHAGSAFVVAAFVLTWLVVRRRWSVGGFVALGALAALMTMVREQDFFFVIGPMIDLGLTVVRRDHGRLRWTGPDPSTVLAGSIAAAGTFALVYLPQLLAYLSLNGRPGPSTLVARKMNWLAPHGLDVLLSPRHGFFVWTPLAVLCIAGLVRLAVGGAPAPAPAHRTDVRRIAVCALVMVAAQAYVAGSVQSWTVAGAFGQRRFVALTVLLAIGLGALMRAPRTRAASAGLVSAIVLCVWWNLGLMAQFGAGLMDRQRLEAGRNAYTTFVVVPARLPELAYRYLFDRSSFYQPAAEDDPD